MQITYHRLPAEFDLLSSALATLETQYWAINSIDTTNQPNLTTPKRNTLATLEFGLELVFSEVEYINLQLTATLRFKAGSKPLAYQSYVKALEKCTELLIYMEQWAGWHKSRMVALRAKGTADKHLPNHLICKHEIGSLEIILGRKLVSTDYLAWSRQVIRNHPNPPVKKATRNSKKNGVPKKPIVGAPVLTTTSGWSDGYLRKKFKELTGSEPTTKKITT